jgi:uncharacterized protein
MRQDPNYGMYRDYGVKPLPRPPMVGVGTHTERTWSVLAHLSTFLNLFTGFLGPVAAFAIWLAYRDRSRTVAFYALQSLWYQVAWLVILAVGWTITGLLTLVLIGLFLVPVMLLLSLVPFVHAAYAAYEVSWDVDYRYLWVAELLKSNRWV